MLSAPSSENKWSLSQTTSFSSHSTDTSSIRGDCNNNNNNNNNYVMAHVDEDEVDDDDDDDEVEKKKKLVEEAVALGTHVSSLKPLLPPPQSNINLSPPTDCFFIQADLQQAPRDQLVVNCDMGDDDSTGGGGGGETLSNAASTSTVSSSVWASPRITELPTTTNTIETHNPELRSSTSLIQNGPRVKPEHLFEEPDTASLEALRVGSLTSASVAEASNTAHLSFLYPPYRDHQSSFHRHRHHQPEMAQVAGGGSEQPQGSQTHSGLLDGKVAVEATLPTSSYHVLTSFTEHVDKAKRKALLALGESEALGAASWWYMLPKMLDNQQQQQQLLGIEHQQQMLSHLSSQIHGDKLHHQQEEPQHQQQMLKAVQHMSELRNELRAMDNHLFQLITYCLTQSSSTNQLQQQSLKPLSELSSSQQSLLSRPQLQTPSACSDVTENNSPPVSWCPTKPQVEDSAGSSLPKATLQPPTRTVNLKKLRLLASAHLYSTPPGVKHLKSLPIKTDELLDTTPTSGHVLHVSKKPRLATTYDFEEYPTSAQQVAVSPVRLSPTTTSPSTRTYPTIDQTLAASLCSSLMDTSLQANNPEYSLPSAIPNCLQPFHSMALAPPLYYYPNPPLNESTSQESYCDPHQQHERGSPNDMSINSNTQQNLLLNTKSKDLSNHNHRLSLLSDSTAQALYKRHQTMPFRCHVCGSGFEDKHRLQQHLSIHLNLHPSWFEEKTIKETMVQYESKRGDYLCTLCRIRYETTAEFDKHMQSHGEKPHRCDLCDQDNKIVSFRYYRQLLTHLRSHCFLYNCKFVSECKQTANRKDYLKLHILKHHLNNKLPDQHIVCCHWKIRKNNVMGTSN